MMHPVSQYAEITFNDSDESAKPLITQQPNKVGDMHGVSAKVCDIPQVVQPKYSSFKECCAIVYHWCCSTPVESRPATPPGEPIIVGSAA